MARTNIDIDEDACAAIMRRFLLKTKRDAVNFALRRVANEVVPMTREELDAFFDEPPGWDGDLSQMRGDGIDPWG
jgi:Arc/MetJ family transcription regulator